MNSIEISRNSIGYKLAIAGGIKEWRIENDDVDSCMYNSAIIKGVFLLAFKYIVGTLFVTAIAAAIGDTIAYTVASIVMHTLTEPNMPAGMLMIIALFMLLAGVVFGIGYLSDKMPKAMRLDTAYTELYDAFKNKYCKKITFKTEYHEG